MDDPGAALRAQEERITLQDLLATLGDEPDSQVASELRDLSATLLAEGGPSGELVASCLLRCGLQLSHKGGIYAAAVALLGVKDDGRVARRVVDGTIKELRACLRDGRARRGRAALRLLESMTWTKVVEEKSVVDLLSNLLEEAEKDEGGNARKWFYIDLVVSVLPWLKTEDGVDELAQKATHMLNAAEMETCTYLKPIADSNSAVQQEVLCKERLIYLKDVLADWVERGRESKVLINYFEELQDDIGKLPPISLPTVNVPSHARTSRYSPPTFTLNLTQEGAMDTEKDAEGTDKNLTKVDSFIVEEYVSCILDNFSSSHAMAAERLLRLPLPKIVNEAVVNRVFGALTALPMPSHSSIYYGTVFVDLCKVKDSSLPIKLLAAVESVFSNAELLDAEVFDRLTSWFAYHLSNYGYKWNWSDWALYADPALSQEFPFRALFCKDVLARCVRLSYFDRIAKAIPDELHVFLPAKPEPKVTHFDPDITAALMKVVTGAGKLPWEQVKQKLEILLPNGDSNQVNGHEKTEANDGEKEAKKSEVDEMLTKAKYGESMPKEGIANGNEFPPTHGIADEKNLDNGLGSETNVNLKRLSSLMRVLLNAGSKILSHFDIVAERYAPLLRELSLVTGEDGQRLVVMECAKFWENSNLHRLYVTDRLYSIGIIPPAAIIGTLLACGDLKEELENLLKSSATWEAVRLVFTRHRARVSGAAQELAAASAAASNAAEGDLDAAQERLSKARVNLETGKTECQRLVMESLTTLERMKSGASDDKVTKWRVDGMITEIARKHNDYLQPVLEKFQIEDREISSSQSHQDVISLLQALGAENFSVVVS
eukprot:Plantae.Rhodophyta-Hildenbrandia_rubra.ctg3480.p1 GENE.Plantae.Rhodophyta-Hildenbrandia_rubra.ctg3480~~Plantae.Rhodophyta-Hildenbrandia_rubra.ctg3480.p1  ORF type:complete len:831 (-),score=170.57 Plantae.Rhodophyta-Hildenbrandia_rubra.ctg3480:592-3084(-)